MRDWTLSETRLEQSPGELHPQRQLVVRIIIVATLVAGTIAAASTAHAASPEPRPTLSVEKRGANVEAAQYLLRARGYTVNVHGYYDSVTSSAVVAFKNANGLGSSDKIDSATWDALFIPITGAHLGTPKDEMYAAQLLLNEKWNAGLTLSGGWFFAEIAAMASFQTHRGINADGLVEQNDWRHLVSHKNEITPNSILCARYSTSGSGSGFTDLWGTSESTSHVAAGSWFFWAYQWINSYSFGPLAVTDFTIEHGNTPGHSSHNYGHNIDFNPTRKDDNQCNAGTFFDWTSYDVIGTLWQAKSLYDGTTDGTTAGAYIRSTGTWFNDPVIQFWYPRFTTLAGHDDHLHVSYCSLSPSPSGVRTC